LPHLPHPRTADNNLPYFSTGWHLFADLKMGRAAPSNRTFGPALYRLSS
jgi:hypothetical protein